MLEDKSPYLVDWAISAQCNLSCKHCRGFPVDELSTERAKKLVSEIAELKPSWVIVEGGEPLLRRDLFQLLELMRQKQLEVHLITNGLLLNPQILANLKRLGIKVMISIDGATPATYEAIRGGASFEQVVASARQCAKEGLLEAINFTILKQNYREIPGVFELAADMGVMRVTLIGLKPCHNYTGELLSPQEYEVAIRLTCEAAQRTGVEFFFDEPFFWAVVKELGLTAQMPRVNTGIMVSSNSACIFGEYLFIEANGEVKPCSFSPLALGSAREKSLVEIWREMLVSPFFSRLKDPKSRTGECQNCQYLADCKGCRSRTFLLTSDWFAADPVCPLSHKLAGERRAK